ncbi:MAG: hypothetical protein CMF48_06910 [Legionellales bacterium]|nr:hypothetical protein [Legionellales bacterium]|tara:strand:- start:862 stop:1989 length:1128 start_codon:yes stop_codon:yes gene_type:complete
MFLFNEKRKGARQARKEARKDRRKRVAQKVAQLFDRESDIASEVKGLSADEIHEAITENVEVVSTHEEKEPGYEAKYVATALEELDRLKDKLGGSPNFGDEHPTLDDPDAQKVLFGVPMTAVKDWLKMTQKKQWWPKALWKKLGALFNAKAGNQSVYEETYLRILRFGRMIANKEHLHTILDAGKTTKDLYLEFCQLTGMAWHPDRNSPAVEKIYMEYIEKFLTEDLMTAKNAGDDMLEQYFRAFEGVCFEDRCRTLQEFAQENLLTAEDAAALQVADWSTDEPVEEALQRELVLCGENYGGERLPTVGEFYDFLDDKRFFDVAFVTESGEKEPLSKEKYLSWSEEMVDYYILDEDEEPRPDLEKGADKPRGPGR